MSKTSVASRNLSTWTKALVQQYGIHAGQRMGQHFLIDQQVLNSIVDAAELKPDESVLEVGGGLGVLTIPLLEKTSRVVVVELDSRLAQGLRKLEFDNHLQVIEGDVLKVEDAVLLRSLKLRSDEQFVIVANLPYEITGAFLRRFLSGSVRPSRMVLLIQLEVANRMAARPGQGSLLWLAAQLYSTIEVLRQVKPGAFLPPPKVTSALVRLNLKSESEFKKIAPNEKIEQRLWELARAGFSSRRKLLSNNLATLCKNGKSGAIRALQQAGLSDNVRAQELSVSDWGRLTQIMEQSGSLK